MGLFVFFRYVCLPTVLAIYRIGIELYFFFTKLRFQIRIHSIFNVLTKLILNNLYEILKEKTKHERFKSFTKKNDSLQFMPKINENVVEC